MKIDKAIEVLKKHNEWRRGAEIEQMDPILIGSAIDTSIEWIESKAKFNPKFEKNINDIENKLQ